MMSIADVLYNAGPPAKIGGLIWLAVGIAVLVAGKLTGRDTSLNLEEAERA